MDLYARLLKEKVEGEHGRGRPLGRFRGSDSKVLDRKLNNPPEDQPRYGADVHRLYQHVHRGVRSQGGAMHFASLKKKYEREYSELEAEARGQGELL